MKSWFYQGKTRMAAFQKMAAFGSCASECVPIHWMKLVGTGIQITLTFWSTLQMSTIGKRVLEVKMYDWKASLGDACGPGHTLLLLAYAHAPFQRTAVG